jgi:hypothetical protein
LPLKSKSSRFPGRSLIQQENVPSNHIRILIPYSGSSRHLWNRRNILPRSRYCLSHRLWSQRNGNARNQFTHPMDIQKTAEASNVMKISVGETCDTIFQQWPNCHKTR